MSEPGDREVGSGPLTFLKTGACSLTFELVCVAEMEHRIATRRLLPEYCVPMTVFVTTKYFSSFYTKYKCLKHIKQRSFSDNVPLYRPQLSPSSSRSVTVRLQHSAV